jgi:hypothetical protein
MDSWIIGLMGIRFRQLPKNPFIQKSNYPYFSLLWPGGAGNKKPTTVSSRGFLLKSLFNKRRRRRFLQRLPAEQLVERFLTLQRLYRQISAEVKL